MGKQSQTACIAGRELLYSLAGQNERKRLSIRIYLPFLVEPGTVDFDDGVAGCRVEVLGLPTTVSDTVYGADTLQALQLAADVEGLVRALTKKYQLYFPTGEPCFDD